MQYPSLEFLYTRYHQHFGHDIRPRGPDDLIEFRSLLIIAEMQNQFLVRLVSLDGCDFCPQSKMGVEIEVLAVF